MAENTNTNVTVLSDLGPEVVTTRTSKMSRKGHKVQVSVFQLDESGTRKYKGRIRRSVGVKKLATVKKDASTLHSMELPVVRYGYAQDQVAHLLHEDEEGNFYITLDKADALPTELKSIDADYLINLIEENRDPDTGLINMTPEVRKALNRLGTK